MPLAEARSLTKLEDFDVEDVFEIFEEVAVDGEIDRRSFDACFENIVKLAGGHPTMALVRRTRAGCGPRRCAPNLLIYCAHSQMPPPQRR